MHYEETYYIIIVGHANIDARFQGPVSGMAQLFSVEFSNDFELLNRQPEIQSFASTFTVEAGTPQQLFLGQIFDLDNDPVETDWTFISGEVDYVRRAFSNIEAELIFFIDPPESERRRVI